MGGLIFKISTEDVERKMSTTAINHLEISLERFMLLSQNNVPLYDVKLWLFHEKSG